MAEVAEEITLEQQRHNAELDATLQRGAEKARASRERQQREGNPESLWQRIAAEAAAASQSSDGAPRREEWTPPPEPPKSRISKAVKEQVPERFRSATLDNFRVETEGQRAARDYVARWLVRAQTTGDAMLALIGPVGCGKSHLLYAAANALIASETHFYARPWYRLADELRYGGPSAFVPTLHDEPHEVRARLFDQRVALLDEVRPTASTAFDDMELVKFVCHAYDNKLCVLVTSNVNPLAEVMGPAAASRFRQVIVDGRDARQSL